MIRVDEIEDFGVLREAAKLLENAVSKLQTEISQLRLELALQNGTARAVEQSKILEEELARLKAAHFAPSSEKRQSEEKPESIEAPAEASPAKRGHGPTAQPRLPIEEKVYEISTDEAVCPDCGKPRAVKDGLAQESELITVVGVQFKLEKVTQLIYGCECPDGLYTAPGPDRVIPGGRYSLEFAVLVAIDKHLDHMPLARQQRAMERQGLEISRTTLWDQIDALAAHLEPSWRALREYVIGADWVHADETRWPMLDGPGSTNWWTWCLASADAVYYDINQHRSAKAARELLDGFEGVLITDGYAGYDALGRAGPNITHAHCWAHVRRKFLEAESAYPEQAKAPIGWITELFEIERRLPQLPRDMSLAERNALCEERGRIRQQESRPVIDQLREWGHDILPTLLPSTGLAKAINYMLKLWPGLTVFLNDARVPIHNNHAERELRGVVVGRKNHYGSKSKRGTEVAALFYSLCETAKLVGVNPETYLCEAARRAIRHPGTVTLPHDLVS